MVELSVLLRGGWPERFAAPSGDHLRPGHRSLPAGRAGLRRPQRPPHHPAATTTPRQPGPQGRPHSLDRPLAVAGLLGSLWDAGAPELADRAAADFSLNDLDIYIRSVSRTPDHTGVASYANLAR